ncbi:hypothetical protein ACHAPU_004856 [Fusarium lateritium]
MQMHLLTNYEIHTYVFGHFKGIRAFLEFNSLYQNGGDRLLDQIVSKADGVFLWTALTTQTMLQSLIEGALLPQLEAMLNKMPPEIESLYDAIYSTIPERLLPEVSVMLQMYVSAHPPVDWVTLWVSDKARGGRVNIKIDEVDRDQVYRTLKRRLSARTRGLLEAIKSIETVEFLHRTAAEWVKQPKVWKQLQSVRPSDFDPHMCLLRAQVTKLQNRDLGAHPTKSSFWKLVLIALYYASCVDVDVVPAGLLIETIDELDHAAFEFWGPHKSGASLQSFSFNQPAYQQHVFLTRYPYNSFHGLTVQFAIVPYIRYKFEKSRSRFHAVPSEDFTPLLEQAVFGFRKYVSPGTLTGIEGLEISTSRQLETVDCLLSQGLRQPGVASLIADAACTETSDSQLQYYRDAMNLLHYHKALNGG